MSFTFDRISTPKVVEVESPDTEMDYKSLYRAIREWQALPMNMDLDEIATASGEDSLGGVFETALTVDLSDEWRVQFWDGVGRGFGAGGNLVGGYGGEPLDGAPGSGDTVKQLDTQGGVVVTSEGGGGTPAEVADAVWDEAAADHVIADTFGAKSQKVVPSENVEDYKADVSGAALEATLQGVKDKTDAMNWSDVTSLRDAVEFLRDVEGGRWQITNNQMVFYKADNKTVVARFNLYDERGAPATKNVFERRRA